MSALLEKHYKGAIITSIASAICGILLVLGIYLSPSKPDAKNANAAINCIASDFFVPSVVNLSGESIDDVFKSANQSKLSPEFFWDNKALLCGDKILSVSEGNLIVSSTEDQYYIKQYNLNIEGLVTAMELKGKLNVVFCEAVSGNLMITDLNSAPRQIGDITCALGKNLGSVFSDGNKIYYVDSKSRTVCSVLPDGSNKQDVSVVRVSSYFILDKDIYYSNGTMLNCKKTYGGSPVWLYECDHIITDISATEDNVYLGWQINANEKCGARFNLEAKAYTPLSGNPVKTEKSPSDAKSDPVTSNLKNDEIPEGMPDISY